VLLLTVAWTFRTRIASSLAALTTALFVLGAGSALAAPPVNDDYLQSIRIVDRAGRLPAGVVQDMQDTTDATVQADLFAPDATGGGVEPVLASASCGDVRYGSTVWYDFAPVTAGAVELQASGPENVLVLYEFDQRTSLLGRRVACASPSSSTDLIEHVVAGKSYTIQIGDVDRGAGPATGPTTFRFEYFADADGDGVLDALDKCPTYAGLDRFGGCPATVDARAIPRLALTGGRLSFGPLKIIGPPETKVSVRCHRGCTGHWAKAIKQGSVTITKLKDVPVHDGTQLDIYLTKHDLFGRFLRYTVIGHSLQTARRCLLPVAHPKPLRKCAGATPAS
jgi:hypothetical protein